MDSLATLFLKYNYPETKEMCKQFLTLTSAILVLSLTFSDKIVNFSQATTLSRSLVISSWISLLVSIIFCGVGLLLITMAAGRAVYSANENEFLEIASKSYISIIVSGVCFVVGLVLLIGTAITTLRLK